MFKKEPRVKPASNLKNSERKKLQTTVQTQFESPDFKFESNVVKQTNFISTVTQGIVYVNEDGSVPLLFKEKFGSQLYPTVALCWSCPKLLPVIQTHQFVIDEHIFNGANLMISGTVPPFSDKLKNGTVCGIVSRECPNVILAVGVVNLPNITKYNKTGVLGQTGVVVNVLHHYEDGLFPAFKSKLSPPESIEIATKEEEEEQTTERNQSEQIEEQAREEKDITSHETQNESQIDDIANVLDKLSIENVDHFITRALYYTIVEDSTLTTPINSSNFISQHLMKNLARGLDHNEVNIKKSSWKKTSKFLKHFEKAGFLKLKGKDDDLIILSINKTKDELKNFVPHKINNVGEPAAATPKKNATYYTSLTYYQPHNKMKEFMRSNCTQFKPYYDSNDVKDAVNKYIQDNNLVNVKNKTEIMLDDILMSATSSKKRIVKRSEILTPILKQFTKYYQIFDQNGTPILKKLMKGTFPTINIITEMKIGRKVITRVDNFEMFNIDADKLSIDLKKLCSGSATLNDTGKNGLELQIQGAHGPLIQEYLNDKCHIPSKWCNIENKVKSKKKKKT